MSLLEKGDYQATRAAMRSIKHAYESGTGPINMTEKGIKHLTELGVVIDGDPGDEGQIGVVV